MHELSIANAIVEGVAEKAARCGITRVAAVHLSLGPLSGVVRDALLFAWPLAAEGTVAEGAPLVVADAPVTIFCSHCQAVTSPRSWRELVCSACGSAAGRVASGTELEVTAFEVDDDEPATVG
ncbi:MAG: hydrogenase maturation nickel metallochaperone HypA [Acidobacteria bacterium]|nr:hydrogenase maturation nickel metallochaperone HypA [Acidobacteriota bacterium]